MKDNIRLLVAMVITIAVNYSGYSQVYSDFVDSQKQRIMMCERVYYYGIDFSHFGLVNAKKMGQGEHIKSTYIPAWIADFYEEKPLRHIYRTIDTVHNVRNPFQFNQLQRCDSDALVCWHMPDMKADTLAGIVDKYELEEDQGIGLSFIITEFNKPDEMVLGYITFFDIATRNLLYVIASSGEAQGMGMTGHWLSGMSDAWNNFFNDFPLIREYAQ